MIFLQSKNMNVQTPFSSTKSKKSPFHRLSEEWTHQGGAQPRNPECVQLGPAAHFLQRLGRDGKGKMYQLPRPVLVSKESNIMLTSTKMNSKRKEKK